MKKENKNLIMMVGIAAVMVMGIIAQNALSVIRPKTAQIKIDVEKVKQEINDTGLVPRKALHWKEL